MLIQRGYGFFWEIAALKDDFAFATGRLFPTYTVDGNARLARGCTNRHAVFNLGADAHGLKDDLMLLGAHPRV
jgi:hypothetical protein